MYGPSPSNAATSNQPEKPTGRYPHGTPKDSTSLAWRGGSARDRPARGQRVYGRRFQLVVADVDDGTGHDGDGVAEGTGRADAPRSRRSRARRSTSRRTGATSRSIRSPATCWRLRTPARCSIRVRSMKSFAVSAALDAYGPDHTFKTPVYKAGSVSGGTLDGNLVLVAAGDFSFGLREEPDGSLYYENLPVIDHSYATLGQPGAVEPPGDPLGCAQRVRQAGEGRRHHRGGRRRHRRRPAVHPDPVA